MPRYIGDPHPDRAEFEHWYVGRAWLDSDPIGSRKCADQWDAWLAARNPSPASPSPVAEGQPVARVRLRAMGEPAFFAKDAIHALPLGDHDLFSQAPKPASAGGDFVEDAGDVLDRFYWMLTPDAKGNHTVKDLSVKAVIRLCEKIIAAEADTAKA